jgi:hypothetical protein
MSREQVERVALKWAEFFPVTPNEPEQSEPEPEPIGKGNVIPTAGHSPGGVPTEAQLIGLAEASGDVETARRLKFAQLGKLIEQTWY